MLAYRGSLELVIGLLFTANVTFALVIGACALLALVTGARRLPRQEPGAPMAV